MTTVAGRSRRWARMDSSGRAAGPGSIAALAGLLALAGSAVGALGAYVPAAGASGVGPLRPLACTAMASDPAVEAPLYAQDEGASGQPDGWWCQLPHATEMPVGFAQLHRQVSPLAKTFALFSTRYGRATAAGSPTSSGGAPSVTVTAKVDAAVTPPAQLPRPSLPRRAGKVRLAPGVTAAVTVSGSSVTVTWPYPSSGVPKYLRAVVEVVVSSTGLPKAVALQVARHVEPG